MNHALAFNQKLIRQKQSIRKSFVCAILRSHLKQPMSLNIPIIIQPYSVFALSHLSRFELIRWQYNYCLIKNRIVRSARIRAGKMKFCNQDFSLKVLRMGHSLTLIFRLIFLTVVFSYGPSMSWIAICTNETVQNNRSAVQCLLIKRYSLILHTYTVSNKRRNVINITYANKYLFCN